MNHLQADLDRRRAQSLYRSRRLADSPQGPEMRIDGRSMLTFCSNDYLGLAADPRLIEAMQQGARQFGAGSGAAHLITGHMAPHHALEEELADFLQRPRALLFSTGYMANLGVISALVGPGDSVWEDRLNHASLIDGGLLSRARFRRYPHNDAAALAARLKSREPRRRSLVVSDGVFSMDGDIAPLPQLVHACEENGAWLMVDDAHGLGVLGAKGGGSPEHFGLGVAEVPILMGTLGKALGSFGAFVAGEDALIETLIQQARSYIYTTAPPPAVAQVTRTALKLVREEPWRRERLGELIRHLRRGAGELGLPLMPSTSPIQPLLAGRAYRAVDWSRRLEQKGILVTAIRPPTVPEGGARLRITLSAAHTLEQVDRLLEALAELPREGG
jgi:8-amino-7-oxononanoate synthase